MPITTKEHKYWVQQFTTKHTEKIYWNVFLPELRDATVLFSMLSSPLGLLFWGVSRFIGFLSDTCFLRQNPFFLRRYPILPRFLRVLPFRWINLPHNNNNKSFIIPKIMQYLKQQQKNSSDHSNEM